MKKSLLILSILAIPLFASSYTNAGLLGSATDYNAFIFGEIDVNNSDSKGRFAAGGNIDIEFYGIGGEADPIDFTIIGGGDVDFYSGTVSNGGIFAAGDVYLDHHTIYGDVIANGSINIGPGGGTIYGDTASGAGVESPIDFGNAYSYLSSTSDTLNNMSVNGTTAVEYVTNITFTGSEDVNVFSLAGSDLNNANVITFNMGEDDVAIINVSGDSDHFTSLGIIGTYQQSNVLWNFYEATSLTLNTTVQGSILAPDADVTFNTGNLYGTLVAESLTGTGEFHQDPFNPPVVPEPVSSTLFIVGGAVLGFKRFRKKQKNDQQKDNI